MKRVWVIEIYNGGSRAVAFEVLLGGPEPLLGDVYDGAAWLVRLLIDDANTACLGDGIEKVPLHPDCTAD